MSASNWITGSAKGRQQSRIDRKLRRRQGELEALREGFEARAERLEQQEDDFDDFLAEQLQDPRFALAYGRTEGLADAEHCLRFAGMEDAAEVIRVLRETRVRRCPIDECRNPAPRGGICVAHTVTGRKPAYSDPGTRP